MDPASIAMLISAIVAVISTITSTTLAAENAKAVQDNADRQAAAIHASQVAKAQANAERAGQEADAASIKKDRLDRQAAAAQARAKASAAEAGVEGNSVAALVREAEGRRLEGIGAIELNEKFGQRALAQSGAAINAEAASKLNSLDAGPGVGLAVLPGIISGGAKAGDVLFGKNFDPTNKTFRPGIDVLKDLGKQ